MLFPTNWVLSLSAFFTCASSENVTGVRIESMEYKMKNILILGLAVPANLNVMYIYACVPSLNCRLRAFSSSQWHIHPRYHHPNIWFQTMFLRPVGIKVETAVRCVGLCGGGACDDGRIRTNLARGLFLSSLSVEGCQIINANAWMVSVSISFLGWCERRCLTALASSGRICGSNPCFSSIITTKGTQSQWV